MANPSRSEELQCLHARAAEICANTVSARSRAVYRNSYARFIVWLLTIRTSVNTDDANSIIFDRLPTDQKLLRTAVSMALDGDISQPPLSFQALGAEDFVVWLLTLCTTTGTQLSYSALNTHRAGLFNLFRVYKEGMSKALERGLSDHFKGLKRSIAEKTAAGSGQSMKVGKDPLQFDLYKFLCSSMLTDTSLEMVFSRTYRVVPQDHLGRDLGGMVPAAAAFVTKQGSDPVVGRHVTKAGQRDRTWMSIGRAGLYSCR
ncbi:hypothetical protein PHMEG_00011728 [Phytophthora megakarya]|uniref:Uncharacterized protein n=1 Tax=Phytophthora megakarya TaxID=4795 RepID=A0A225WCM8_9STRA|nr:hypothetical protein PHMEG_00011728 [Phytophthora megakarya]